MVGLTKFWCVIGGILSLVGFYFINHKSKNQRDYTVLGVVLLSIGIMVAVGAQLNIYINSTQEDLVRFMFWMKD